MKEIHISKIDWKWVGVGYCFFVVFHMLPIYILNGMSFHDDVLTLGVELFGGIAIIAFFIGYKSRGVTILEPALSALLYDMTLLLEFRNLWGKSPSDSVGLIVIWGFLTLVTAICSAWLGELYQARKTVKT